MTVKEKIHEKCVDLVQERIESLENELQELAKSQSSDTKSSAGDKYETGREMINLERNKLSERLLEASKMMAFLSQLNPKVESKTAKAGALVSTAKGLFYISTSLGVVDLNNQKYFVISPVSPIGQAMLDKKVGDSFVVNNVRQTIKSID